MGYYVSCDRNTYINEVRDVLRDEQENSSQPDPDCLHQDNQVTAVSTGHGYQQTDDESRTEDDSEEEDFDSYQDQSLAQVYLDGVVSLIDRLYRVSFKIRNPAMRIGFSKALTYHEVDENTGVDLIDQYKQADLSHLQELFSYYHHASPKDYENHFLVHRLAKANIHRRQQFRYWRKRKAKFERIREPILDQDAQSTLQRIGVHNMIDAAQIAHSQPSTATRLDVTKVDLDDDRSVISTSTHVIMANDNDEDRDQPFFPEPPKKALRTKEFECPYCFTMCPNKMLAKKAWK
jgi:hypothetical protein